MRCWFSRSAALRLSLYSNIVKKSSASCKGGKRLRCFQVLSNPKLEESHLYVSDPSLLQKVFWARQKRSTLHSSSLQQKRNACVMFPTEKFSATFTINSEPRWCWIFSLTLLFPLPISREDFDHYTCFWRGQVQH